MRRARRAAERDSYRASSAAESVPDLSFSSGCVFAGAGASAAEAAGVSVRVGACDGCSVGAARAACSAGAAASAAAAGAACPAASGARERVGTVPVWMAVIRSPFRRPEVPLSPFSAASLRSSVSFSDARSAEAGAVSVSVTDVLSLLDQPLVRHGSMRRASKCTRLEAFCGVEQLDVPHHLWACLPRAGLTGTEPYFSGDQTGPGLEGPQPAGPGPPGRLSDEGWVDAWSGRAGGLCG